MADDAAAVCTQLDATELRIVAMRCDRAAVFLEGLRTLYSSHLLTKGRGEAADRVPILHYHRMFRRTHKHLLVWLLPLLLVQLLVPTGYMLTAGQGGLEIAFCPVQSGATLEALSKHADGSHAHHDAHPSQNVANGEDHSEHARSASCPFALSGAPLVVPAPTSIILVLVAVHSSAPVATATPAGVLLFERNRIRGPPQLA